jgi:hypothetical protein
LIPEEGDQRWGFVRKVLRIFDKRKEIFDRGCNQSDEESIILR